MKSGGSGGTATVTAPMRLPDGHESAASAVSEQVGTPNADRMSSVRPGGNLRSTLRTWDCRSGSSFPGTVSVTVGAVRAPAWVVLVWNANEGWNGTAAQPVGVKLDCAD